MNRPWASTSPKPSWTSASLSGGSSNRRFCRTRQPATPPCASGYANAGLSQAHRSAWKPPGPYSEGIALALTGEGWFVSVVNPARVKGFAQSQLSRNKNDRVDARLLAMFARSAELERWQPPSPALRELRVLVERLQALIEMRQQELNRLEAMTQSTPTSVARMVQEHIAWLEEQIRRIDSDIGDHIDGHPELRQDAELICSIPGIGERTAARLLAYLGDVRRFRSAKALAAFIGVTPRQRHSGTSLNGRTVLSRAGHAAARRALYMPGLVATRHNPAIIAMKARLHFRFGALHRKPLWAQACAAWPTSYTA